MPSETKMQLNRYFANEADLANYLENNPDMVVVKKWFSTVIEVEVVVKIKSNKTKLK